MKGKRMLFLLTGEVQTGKTRWLERAIAEWAAEGIETCGVIAPGVWRICSTPEGGDEISSHNSKHEKLGIDNVLLPEGVRVPFARRRDLAQQEGSFDPDSQSAKARLAWAISDEAIAKVNAHFDELAQLSAETGVREGAQRERALLFSTSKASQNVTFNKEKGTNVSRETLDLESLVDPSENAPEKINAAAHEHVSEKMNEKTSEMVGGEAGIGAGEEAGENTNERTSNNANNRLSDNVNERTSDNANKKVNEKMSEVNGLANGLAGGMTSEKDSGGIGGGVAEGRGEKENFEGHAVIPNAERGRLPGLLVVDELGRLELEHDRGLTSALRLLDGGPTAGFPHALVVVRSWLADRAEQRFRDAWGGVQRIEPGDSALKTIRAAFSCVPY